MLNNGDVGIRTSVWRQMGLLYGGLAGHVIGQNMDLLIQTVNKLVAEPLEGSNNTFAASAKGQWLVVDVQDNEQSQRVMEILREAGAVIKE